ncbi:MAG: dCTP deaminase [Elusimicrobiota bacterium]|nr:dCTP deaminase [Elusimicrobiota bacterium]
MLKNDKWIKKMSTERGMISPFCQTQIREVQHKNSCGLKKIVSFGTSSYGYDMRLSDEFMVMSKLPDGSVLDPKNSCESFFEKLQVIDFITVYPNSTVLGRSIEYFNIPRDVLAISFGKSTYARCGIVVNITPLEPEWEGFVTLAISNINNIPVKIYTNEGIAQVLFLQSDDVCEVSYSDRKGKYNNQKNIAFAKI